MAKKKRKIKKKRATKRPTKARKPQPVAKPNLPPFVENYDPTPSLIAANQRKRSAAVQSMSGEVIPALPPSITAATMGVEVSPPAAALNITASAPDVHLQGVISMKADGFVLPAPIPVTPTVYPDTPHGTVIVQNYVTINIHSAEFSRFDKNLEALIGELHRSNEISGEVREQLVSELWAGREIIGAPKPQRALIDLLLVGPLKWLSEKSGSAIIGKLAADALDWLLRML